MERSFESRRQAVTDLEKEMLWAFVRLVYIQGKCECGQPPYENDEVCNACFATELLARFGRLEKEK